MQNKDTNHPLDQRIDRKNSSSVKWNGLQPLFSAPDAIPLWVADMDFTAPEPVLKALRDIVDHGILGYAMPAPSFNEAIAAWMAKRHGWKVEPEWLVYTPGIVPALNIAVEAFTEPGDKIIIQPPVYGPFHKLAKTHGRVLVENPLIHEQGEYRMDLTHLEQAASQDGVKLIVLCSPHNPVGRVWSREELNAVMEIAVKHDIIVISDEIHSDLVFESGKHIPYAVLSEEAKMHSIICTAASKTFNIAGLHTSSVVIANKELRLKFKNMIDKRSMGSMNLFGLAATEAAYREGEPWLESTLEYIHGNLEYVVNYFKTYIPECQVTMPEATYLLWIDFRNLGMEHKELFDFLVTKAGLVFSSGTDFGKEGEGFMRMNVACPRSMLEEAMQQLHEAMINR
ncbi:MULTISPECIES: PatB family C-S lyase [unclassified Paenibacillus]|uniref:cysteine-S-conjugate beta-lyase n=1 Tax=Paenibacillus provencensis TaxID=441151 RepID=A0ABW3PY27_9BACL|nr:MULTISPECIES: PatB family C-S lyase [unclassified Paenibacillus]MCM3127453.1 PatB family C-S lyase [Paenibacillus sp. MER 78]SFS42474.1 cystathione beta-lyase [Paenibacillus sp. 453mf]